MRDNDVEFSILSGSDEELLFGCVESIAKTLKGSSYSWTITVTCRATGRTLPNRLRTRYPGITVLEGDSAKSFAASHNRVLRISRARYVWLLDADLLILPDAVRLMTEFLDLAENTRIGVASPQLLKADGTFHATSHSFPSMQHVFMTEFGLPTKYQTIPRPDYRRPARRPSRIQPVDSAIEVDALARGCIAVRTSAFRQVGPMVDDALKGSELPEWHRRFHQQGWRVVCLTDANVIHYGSRTGSSALRSLTPEYLEGALYFFRTGRSPATYLAFCAAILGSSGLRAAYSWLARDRSGLSSARDSAAVAWRGMKRKPEKVTQMEVAS